LLELIIRSAFGNKSTTMRDFVQQNGHEQASDTLLESPCNDPDNEYGLWISYDGHRATFRFVKDRNEESLHPHIYIPAETTNTHVLKGGGSGATVFSGDLYDQKLVWKHGDQKDMGEVFALASIEHELLDRSETAAEELRSRIPTFKGIYISPNHIRIRSQELWKVVERSVRRWSLEPVGGDGSMHNSIHSSDSGSEIEISALPHLQRRFCICSGSSCYVDARKSSVRVFMREFEMGENGELYCDYENLKELVDSLRVLQQRHFWKFSIAQSRIGGPNPQNAAALHLAGKLRGPTLNKLVDQFVCVLRSLQDLAREEERDAAELVRVELESMDDKTKAADVSPLANSFVGFSIVKNFDSEKGRFKLIRETGMSMLNGTMILRPEEELPAKVLSIAFQDCRSAVSPLFGIEQDLSLAVAIHEQPHTWQGLLYEACHLKNHAATRRVWTCGLTDAGIHNMFFSNDRLWLFDLGEPSLQPIPAFLTKPLMSFFHTLGMEETADGKGWVNRFEPCSMGGDLVQLTEKTKELLPMAYESFDLVINRIVQEMFDGEEAVHRLLIKYVVLQLSSDAAFCLERWQRKGGGSPSYDNHQIGLEKWLWRAVWDLYICQDVSRHYYGRIEPDK
jgi:hypothetical protein